MGRMSYVQLKYLRFSLTFLLDTAIRTTNPQTSRGFGAVESNVFVLSLFSDLVYI